VCQKVIVIGSNSFSGSHFVKKMLSKGYDVTGVSRSAEYDAIFLPYKWKKFEKFQFHQLDLNHDLDDLIALIKRVSPDYIVNFAAQSMVAESWQSPQHWFTTNTVSTIMLHEELRTCSFLKKYVHVSTPEVYGNCTGNVTESQPYNPSTPYAVSRAATDMSLKAYYKAYGFPVVFTRSANVYGPGQQLYRIIPKALLCFLAGRKLSLHGGGASVRSFIHIEDVADATYLAMKHGAPGEIFHFSVDETISIRSLVQRISDLLDVDFEQFVDVAEDRLGKDAAYRLETAKARKELQWEPKIGLDEGLKDTARWVVDNLENLKTKPDTYIHKP
jgi:dTDP-glucose 4,6-dehydratase